VENFWNDLKKCKIPKMSDILLNLENRFDFSRAAVSEGIKFKILKIMFKTN